MRNFRKQQQLIKIVFLRSHAGLSRLIGLVQQHELCRQGLLNLKSVAETVAANSCTG